MSFDIMRFELVFVRVSQLVHIRSDLILSIFVREFYDNFCGLPNLFFSSKFSCFVCFERYTILRIKITIYNFTKVFIDEVITALGY